MKNLAKLRVCIVVACSSFAVLAGPLHSVPSNPTCDTACIHAGGVDDTLYVTHCCSGRAVTGSTWCTNPADYGTTWASCHQICAGPDPVCGSGAN
jgi:hypothetical protein